MAHQNDEELGGAHIPRQHKRQKCDFCKRPVIAKFHSLFCINYYFDIARMQIEFEPVL
jgi:hypothetical protein